MSEFTERLRQEVLEEQGLAPVTSGRPACPQCGALLVASWGRNSQKYRIMHPNKPCPREFDVFATGATEEEAWSALP